MSGDPNPYAPPKHNEAEGSPWYTDGSGVFAREGATLPAIDPEAAVEPEDLVPVHKHFIRRSVPYQMANVVLPLVPLQWDEQLAWLSWLMAVLTWWVPRWRFLRLPSVIASSIQFTYFIDAGRLKKFRRLKIIGSALAAMIVLSAAWILWFYREEMSMPILVILGILLFALYIVARLAPSKLFMTAGPEGWARIGGIHPAALRLFKERESQLKENSRSA